MRIESGSTTRYLYFVAVDSTDLKTRETGLTTFTVYRSRNGAAAAAMTTPTVNEVDATNMPGVYELLLDEDTTVGAGNDTEEMVFHITQASMAPVTRSIELYRPETTAGNTLDVTATGAAGIDWANVENQTTAVDLSATDIQLCDTTTAVTNGVTASTVTDKTGYSISGTKTTLDALNDVSTAEVNTQADLALSDIGLNHLISASVADTDVADNSIIAKLTDSTAVTADFTNFDWTTDSLRAVRDHIGNGTNLTEAGGTGDHLTAINLPNQTMDITGNITGNLSGSVGSVTGAVGSVTGAVGSVTAGVTLADGAHGGASASITLSDYSNFQGSAGSDRLLLVDTTIATLASQVSFTLTAGSTDDDAYTGMTIVIEDATTSAQKAVGTVSNYTGVSRTVTLLNDPGIFTMAQTDKVYILAEKAVKPTSDGMYYLDITGNGNAGIDWGNIDNKTATVDLSATDIQLVDTTTTNTDMRGTDNAALATALATAQLDLDTITGSDGVTLATTQGNYAPATAAALTTHDGKLDTVDANVDLVLADTAELQGDWVDGGRLDLLLDGAASAGDPWTTSLPGAYGAGTAGYIVGNNIDAALSTLATAAALSTAQTDLDTLTGTDGVTLATSQPNYAPATAAALTTHDGKLDTVDANVDLVLADTAELQGDWVDGGRLDLLLDTASSGGDATAANQTTLINAIGTMTDLGGGADVANNLADIAGATFATGTDSLEAIRNRGDSDWSAAGSSPMLLQNTTIATLASQVSFTLTDGSTDDDAYNGLAVIITDSATSTQKAVAVIDDYTGSTKTVTLRVDPGIFTMAEGDTIDIIAGLTGALSAATGVEGWVG